MVKRGGPSAATVKKETDEKLQNEPDAAEASKSETASVDDHPKNGDDNMPKTSASTKKKPTAKKSRSKKAKRRSTGRRSAAIDSDTEDLKARLLKRNAKDDPRASLKLAKMENERGPIIKRKLVKSESDQKHTGEPFHHHQIVNPSSYDKLFSRLEETHYNKSVKPDGVYLDNTPWICCFCQRKPCVDDLGDLFGPYYVKLSSPEFWPPFIEQGKKSTSAAPSGSSSTADAEAVADLWFHGDCVYWAHGILLRGGGLTGLEEYMPSYWKQKCTRCQEFGANLSCAVKGCKEVLHYPCAVASNAIFKEPTFQVYCESHRKAAEKRKLMKMNH